MTQKDKDLLLCDLCTRLLYGVNVAKGNVIYPMTGINVALGYVTLAISERISIEKVKPYLRSMESMTEEEKSLFLDLRNALTYQENGEYDLDDFNELQDFLNRNHLDYRGLIEMGFAIEAPEGMYNN